VNWARLVCVLGLLGLAACADEEPIAAQPEASALTGTVWYRERVLLPPGAKVTVSLQDVAKQDVAAVVIGETVFFAEGSPPYPFEIQYDPAAIDRRGDYALRATIHFKDRLVFTSDQKYPAFDEEAREILVRRVPAMRPRPQKQE
jgi:putative lipoprotein